MRHEIAAAVVGGCARAPAKNHRRDGAVELGQGHHHGRLDRQQAALGRFPILEGLELESMRGDIGHIETGKQRFSRRGIIVGWATDEGETGQRDEGIDRGLAVGDEELLRRGTCVEPAREDRNDAKSCRFERADDGIVMRRVVGENVRAHQQQADGAARAGALGQTCQIV